MAAAAVGAEEWSVSKKGGGGGGDGGFGVERDVFNACFILCFLEGGGGDGDNACLLWPLNTLFFPDLWHTL